MTLKGPLKPDLSRPLPRIRLFEDKIRCGFPSPAEGYTDVEIDFNRYLMEHPASSYCFYVKGDSMEGLHIAEGDLIVVDRSRTPVNNSIIVCSLDGSFTLKRFEKRGSRYFLMPANIHYEPIEITGKEDFQCWGVATSLVRKF